MGQSWSGLIFWKFSDEVQDTDIPKNFLREQISDFLGSNPRHILLNISWNDPKNRYVASLFTVRGSLVILELLGLFVFRQFFEHYYGFYCWFIEEFMVSIHVSELHYYSRALSPLSRIILKLHLHQVASSPIFF